MLPHELALKILEWVREDMPFWDLTTDALIPDDVVVKASVVARSSGVAACVKELAEALRILGLEAQALVGDGESFSKGSKLMIIKGPAKQVLMIERVLLNLLSHLIGVATATRRLVELASRVGNVRVAATRKVIPGLRSLVKKAVMAGGGDTHRLSLSDAYIIKDNHLAIVGSVEEAVKRVKKVSSFMHRVEVEVESVEDALKAARAGADVVMLDNMSPEQVREAVNALIREGLRGKVVIEVSGGVGPENIVEYAEAGPDVISTSYITMKASPADLSLEVEEVVKQ